MSIYTKEDIIRRVEKDEVESIRMQFTDIFGQLKMLPLLNHR
jgi:glutamine synthetase